MVGITATVKANEGILEDILAAHALSGYDTTGNNFGIGKGSVLKALMTGNSPLSTL